MNKASDDAEALFIKLQRNSTHPDGENGIVGVPAKLIAECSDLIFINQITPTDPILTYKAYSRDLLLRHNALRNALMDLMRGTASPGDPGMAGDQPCWCEPRGMFARGGHDLECLAALKACYPNGVS